MRAALTRHDAIIEQFVADHAGQVVRPRGEGDSRFAVFVRPSDAVACAGAVQLALTQEHWPTPEPLRVRMAVHTGEADLRLGDYYGPAVNHCARLRGAAHGGQILVSDVTADIARESLTPELTFRDLGLHQLQDLEQPEPVWQLVHPGLTADFPPIRLITREHRNMPVQLTSFVGRQEELLELQQLLATTRLVTLTGAGGTGKTRLAGAVGDAILHQFPDGVWFVELASLSEPDLVASAIVASLQIRELAGRSARDTLVAMLESRSVLLILDNCEHLVEGCASLADDLLRACPKLHVLATSREPLRIAGERTWRVATLPVPDSQHMPGLAALSRYPAVRLFVERARAVQSDFALTDENSQAVVGICAKLDGLPLAIELAAAWVRVLDCEQILRRLEDAFTVLVGGSRTAPYRQRTLRATLDWSSRLLTPAEQRLFRRLAVFSGGFDLEAVEYVCRDNETRADPLEVLSGLVDKSLLLAQVGSAATRYRLLEPVRQYAAEQLLACGEAEPTKQRHAEFYARWFERLGPLDRGPDSADHQALVERERGNMRAALRWLIGSGQTAHRLALRLVSHFAFSGRASEGRVWVAELLSLPSSAGKTGERVGTLIQAAKLEFVLGDSETGRRHAQEALAIARELPDWSSTAAALFQLAQAASRDGQYATARSLAEEGIMASRVAGALEIEALNQWVVAQAALQMGDQSAGAFAERALSLATEALYPFGIALALTTLGNMHRSHGDIATARVLLERALAADSTTQSPGRVWRLASLGMVATEQGDLDGALAYLTEAILFARDVLGQGADLFMPLDGFGQLAAALHQPFQALRLVGAAAALRDSHNVPLPATTLALQELWLSRARESLGHAAAETAWLSGRRLSVEQAIAEALALRPGSS
jgi:predicted ATPase